MNKRPHRRPQGGGTFHRVRPDRRRVREAAEGHRGGAHVVSGKIPASAVVKLNSATTLNGQNIRIAVNDGKVTVNNAAVTQADIEASNLSLLARETGHVVEGVWQVERKPDSGP